MNRTNIIILLAAVVISIAAISIVAFRGKDGSSESGHGAHNEAGHGAEAGHADEADHGDEAKGKPAALSTAEIEAKECEHKIKQVACDECRFELGVVKVAPSVTDSLVKTSSVAVGNATRTLRLTGEVQYDQTTVVDVLPAAPGKVVAVKARLGQRVQKDEVLATIHSAEVGEAKAVYLEAAATADVAAQEARRQSAISAALEKTLAARDDQAGGIPGELLGERKSKLVNALARLRQARMVVDRERALVAKQASSQAELETAEREMQTAQADHTALIEEIQLNIKLDQLKAENAAKLASARLIAAEQKLHLFGLDEAAIKAIPQARDDGTFAQSEVRAPRAGIVTALNLTEGKFVEASQALYTIADTANVWVWCDLYERDLGPLHERLAKGDKPQASVRVTAFADPFSGVVDLIDSAVNETTRTVKVRVQVPNGEAKLRPGMFASIEILLAEVRKVALVPRQAVLSDEGRTFAFVHWKDDLWLRRDVEMGRPQGDLVEVVSGLSAGEKVVAAGGFLFKSDVLRAKMGAGCAD